MLKAQHFPEDVGATRDKVSDSLLNILKHVAAKEINIPLRELLEMKIHTGLTDGHKQMNVNVALCLLDVWLFANILAVIVLSVIIC